jgi:hypothetical protein
LVRGTAREAGGGEGYSNSTSNLKAREAICEFARPVSDLRVGWVNAATEAIKAHQRVQQIEAENKTSLTELALQRDLATVATVAAVVQIDSASVTVATVAAVSQINLASAVFMVRTTHRYLVVVLLVCQKARLLVLQEACFNQKDFAGHLDLAVLEFTTQIILQA